MTDPEVFEKRRDDAPGGFFAAEAAGLAWLAAAEAAGGARTVRVLEVHRDRILLPRLRTAPATQEAALDLGRRLAATHAAGAGWFGAAPPGLDGDGFIGPLPLPHVPAAVGDGLTWGRFHATYRLAPYVRAARDTGALSAAGAVVLDRVAERLTADDEELTGPPEPPARLHGDLWGGNVVWTDGGAVLVDPAAHGGHRETDLAMLALFTPPRFAEVLAGYREAAPLADGWRDRVGLHQLHPLLVHAVLLGAGYGSEAALVARRYA